MFSLIRRVMFALFLSLVFGMVVGTMLRLRLEKPVYFLGETRERLKGILQVVDGATNFFGTETFVKTRERSSRGDHGGGNLLGVHVLNGAADSA